jgi:hypothetical protein
MEVRDQFHVPPVFTRKEITSGIRHIGDWVGLTAGLKAVEERNLLLLAGI